MTERFFIDDNGNYLGSYDDADGDMPEEFVDAVEVAQKPLPPSAPRFFVDEAGKYLGSYDGPDESIPDFLTDGVQVATAPEDAGQVWKDGAWLPLDLPVELTPVTKRQLRLTLVRNGISLASVEALIEGMPESLAKQEAQIEWADAQTFSRDHPTLLLIAQALELTPANVDEMWVEAMVA